MDEKYLVCEVYKYDDDAPSDSCMSFIGEYETLPDAKAAVASCVELWEMGDDFIPGYKSDPDGSEKWSENCYREDGCAAWHQTGGYGFCRVDIYVKEENGGWHHI